jgi:hypothetical protein
VAARTLVVTPWFAAGAGFVLAAGLFLYAPHTELRFPSANAPDEIQCTTVGCQPPGQTGGHLATSSPGQRIKRNGAAHRRTVPGVVTGTDSAVAGLTFMFTVVWQRDGNFDAVISVSGRHVPASWRLAFAMPGTQIGRVLGAEWRLSSNGDGGTASAWPAGRHADGQGGGSGGAGSNAGGPDRGHGRAGFSFWVIGTGSASTPATCVFNGASCSFK